MGLPTKFSFTKHPLITVEGNVEEKGELKTQKIDNAELKYYAMRVEFVQLVKLKAPSKTNISGTIDYMACTDTHCLPPAQKRFSVTLQ